MTDATKTRSQGGRDGVAPPVSDCRLPAWRVLLRRWLPAALSGLLLAAAFPPMESWEAAWVALIPLLLMALDCAPGEAFRWGWISGAFFWLPSMAWLLRLGVTGAPWVLIVPGWAALSAYCALYTGAFCAALSWAAGRVRLNRPDAGALPGLLLLVAAPLLWTGCETWRSLLLTGFPWNALGVSQFRNLAVVQMASWGGVGAVSALVMTLNMALALTLRDVCAPRTSRRRFHPELMAGLLVCVACWLWGARAARERIAETSAWPRFRVAAVQPGIPQIKKWSDAAVADIFASLEKQTGLAQLVSPDLLVWPETAVPGVLPFDEASLAFIKEQARAGTPLLLGALDAEREADTGRVVCWNAALLFDGQGELIDRYRKIRLVPFGEYLPFDRVIPFLRRFSPLGISCLPGAELTIFRLPGEKRTAFAALICFEDAFADLSRGFVALGAALLINQTNDAWFDGSSGARQHMSHAVFRAVENRVALVRATNTGMTCLIDPVGRVDALGADPEDRVDAGFAVYGAPLRPDGTALTVYGRYGNLLFSLPCGVLLLAALLAAVRQARAAAR
jgi:apolipoprotein N-acyltransferase